MKDPYKADLKLPDCSLRNHKSEVTSLIFVQWPTRFQVPILISGDAEGVLLLWDTLTRRPLFTFSPREASQIVAIQDLKDGLIAVLYKDHMLRFLELPKKCLENNEGDDRDSPEMTVPELIQVFTIPVNTLNFANFLLQELGEDYYRLICTNTQDSEAIDIYTFHMSDMHSLKRIYKGVNFSEMIKKLPCEPNSPKVNKLGIVMKFIEREGGVYCGLESGFVIGFRLNDKVNKNGDGSFRSNSIEIVYVSSVHYPNPVLDLSFDKASGCILSTSTSDEVGIHQKISVRESGVEEQDFISDDLESMIVRLHTKISRTSVKRMPVPKISHIVPLDECLLISSWTGHTLVVRDSQVVADISKLKSSVFVTESSQGSFQDENGAKEDQIICKVTSLAGLCGSSGLTESAYASPRKIGPGQRRRLKTFLAVPWCVIGYADGSIAFHRIDSSKRIA